MNLFVKAELVTAVVEAMEARHSDLEMSTDLSNALEKLADAMIVTVQPPHEAVPVATLKGKPFGDENSPTETRLIQRLEAACRLIDSFNVFSIFSIRFVSEQQRFIQELRSNRRPAVHGDIFPYKPWPRY